MRPPRREGESNSVVPISAAFAKRDQSFRPPNTAIFSPAPQPHPRSFRRLFLFPGTTRAPAGSGLVFPNRSLLFAYNPSLHDGRSKFSTKPANTRSSCANPVQAQGRFRKEGPGISRIPAQSGTGGPHSTTLRVQGARPRCRQVMECGRDSAAFAKGRPASPNRATFDSSAPMQTRPLDSPPLYAKFYIVRTGMATVESDGGGSGTRTVFPCAAFVIPGFHATSFRSFASVLLRLCQHSIAPTLHHSRIIQSSTNLVYIMIPAPRLCLLPPVLSLFAANQLKCLSMNYLHSKWVVPKQGQSSQIKPNQSILLCSPKRTNGPISPPFAEAFHFAFCILHSAFPAPHHSTFFPFIVVASGLRKMYAAIALIIF